MKATMTLEEAAEGQGKKEVKLPLRDISPRDRPGYTGLPRAEGGIATCMVIGDGGRILAEDRCEHARPGGRCYLEMRRRRP